MSFPNKKSIPFLIALFLIFAFSQISFAEDVWRPVSPEELAMKKGLVETEADSEAIFWEVRVADEFVPRAGFQSVLNHYLRIKIFTDRGRDDNSKVDIPFGISTSFIGRIEISQIEARTIKPNGTIVLLNEKEIFEREIVKGDGIKLKAKSFVVPGIETGSIIEYRWKEVRRDTFSYYIRLQVAREIPVQMMKYYVKPVSNPNFQLAMRIHTFNEYGDFAKEPDGFYSKTFTNIRSFREEPQMSPEYSVKPWMLVYYVDERDDTKVSQEEYWRNRGKEVYQYHKSIFDNDKNIRQAAVQAISEVTEPLEKVRRVFNFLRGNIKNLDDDALNLTSEQRKKIKENRTEADTLKRGQGTGHDIKMLFAAMLNSVGFEVRVASVTVRTNPPFDRSLFNDYMLQAENLAVKIGDKWQYFDPSRQHLPFGMLSWAEEGQIALISDKDTPVWVTIPNSTLDQSVQKRIVQLQMDEDGMLKGSVRIEFTGHIAEYYRENLDEESDAEREKAVINMVKNRISDTAEVTEVSIENLKDPEKPLVYSFKILVPSYAERTGKRLFLRPNVFARNTKPLFVTSSRQNDIFFNYPWSEIDDFSVVLPEGYTLETSDSPDPITDSRNLGFHATEIWFDEKTSTLKYKREFSFGRNGELEFGSSSYSRLKDLFDSYHKADQHAVTLLKDEAN